jgi:hypothetical protein
VRRGRDLTQVGRRVGDLTTQRHALRDAGQEQQDGRQPAHLLVRRQEGDHHRAAGHQQDGQQHPGLAALEVGEAAEQQATERPEEERQGVGRRGTDQRQRLVLRGEELAGEEDDERRVHRPVEPLDGVADARRDQRLDRQLVLLVDRRRTRALPDRVCHGLSPRFARLWAGSR